MEKQQLSKLFDELFPICRSITGPGLRESLNILQQHIPLKIEGIETGTKVFDWEIPKEWRINEAWIKGPNGEKIIDFQDHNLHIVNYSISVNQKMPLSELKKHLYYNEDLPNAIPYVTSYYKERWGFCLTKEQFDQLADGEYHVYINSEHVDGELNYGHYVLPGESEKEILISSYLCHPSMANNELSGPLVLTFLYKRLLKWKNRKFTYRFVIVPETIGSISYLYKYGKVLKGKVHAGLVLTCLGGEKSLSLKKSRREVAPFDILMEHFIKMNVLEGRIRPFDPTHGSDERQYCSPGFNLPVGQLSRGLDGGFKEYHTSLDNKEYMGIEKLIESVDEIELMLEALELDGYYINNNPYGEVKLDKHNLYPDMNSPNTRKMSNNHTLDQRKLLNQILMILNYSDGQVRLMEIAEKMNCSILELALAIDVLKSKKLISGPYISKRSLD